MQLIVSKRPINKGDIVEVRATSTPFGGIEPESFVMVEVPTVTMAAYEKYSDPWRSILDYTVISQNTVLDTLRIKVFSTTQSVSNLGGITLEQTESFLNRWNATVFLSALNEVVFDFSVYGGATSEAFWETPLLGIVFSEISYDPVTGIHRIQANYSALANNPTYVERYIVGKQGTIISHANKIIVFDISRAIILSTFKSDIKEKVETIINRRRYYFMPAVVDYIIAQGGTLTTTAAQVLTYIKDKLAI